MPHLPWYVSGLFTLLMLLHFFRRRPEGYWFFVIVFLQPLGGLAYFFLEVLPDLRVKPPVIKRFERRRRLQWLEHVAAEIPALEHLQELGELYAAEGQHQKAIDSFSRVLARDKESLEAQYGRAKSLAALGQHERAVADLEPVVRVKPGYQFYDAPLTLAESYERLGREADARRMYEDVLGRTTVSRAYYGYGLLLARQGDAARAREMMQQILAKKPTLPRYLRRQERPWFRKAQTFLKNPGAAS